MHQLRVGRLCVTRGVGVNDWSILLRFAADGDFDCFMLAGPLHAARSQRARHVHARMPAARHLGVDGRAVQLRHPAHPAVASVVTGNRAEAESNLAHCRAPIPADFWSELKQERLIAADAPVPSAR